MAANTLSILRPSVNNLTARVFVRAAGLEFEEVDMWGHKGTPEFLAKDPADLTPLLEAHKIRVARGDYNIDQVHLADAIEALVERSRGSLSADRSAKQPYRHERVP